MCLLSQVYHEGQGLSADEVFILSSAAKQELLQLILWAPCMSSNLRAAALGSLFCTDASPFAAGVCEAAIGETTCLELLRHADHKGYHTRLQPRLAAYLDQFAPFPDEDAVFGASLSEGILYDVCEVFRKEGNLSFVAKQLGLSVHPGFEVKDGPTGDIMQRQTMEHIIGLVCRRVVAYVHLGPPCTTFGTMRRPRLRSKHVPFGFDPGDWDTCEGNTFAMRTGFVLHLCSAYGVLGSCEQPGGSVMYRLHIFQLL